MTMDLILNVPDEIAERLGADGSDLSRRALEALACEEYQAGRLTRLELRRLLGFDTRAAVDAFLKSHGIAESMTMADVEADLRDMERVGL